MWKRKFSGKNKAETNIDLNSARVILLVSLTIRFLRASAMLKHVIDIGWTSACLSVCPSHAGTVSKRLNVLS